MRTALLSIIALLTLVPVPASTQPRTVRVRCTIQAADLRQTLGDPLCATIEAQVGDSLLPKCAGLFPFLLWERFPRPAGPDADTIPLLTVDIVSEPSGQDRPDDLVYLRYSINGEHDVLLAQPRDKSILYSWSDGTFRGKASELRRRLFQEHLGKWFGAESETFKNALMREFLRDVVVTDSIVVDSSRKNNPVILSLSPDELRADDASILRASFQTTVQGDTVDCRLLLSPAGKVKGLQSCKITEIKFVAVDPQAWMTGFNDRLRGPTDRGIWVYMDNYIHLRSEGNRRGIDRSH